jgi:hypothetical protein
MRHILKISAIILFILVNDLFVLKSQRSFQIRKLPFNTDEYAEYAPSYYRDGIVFCSNRKTEVLTVTTTQTGEYLLNLYWVKPRTERKWEEAKLFSRELTSRLVAGPMTVDSTETTLFFTRTRNVIRRTAEDTTEENFFGIYLADFSENEEWTDIRPWKYNPDSFHCGYPFLSKDEKVLFFSSNKPGGYGRYDIYTSEKDDEGNWKEPVNIGNVINTGGSEVYPFYHESGRLYFASDGHGGRGRMDLFYSDYVDGQWKEPVNLPSPLNTRYNDFALIINSTLDSGYLSTDRYGSDDIISFSSGLPIFSDCERQREDSYCYEVYETGTIDLDTTTFEYEWDLGDGTKIRNLSAYHCYEGPGTYIIKLNVIDTLTGDIYYEEARYRLPVERIEQPYITVVDTGVINEELRMDALQTNLKDFTIDGYYWDFGDGERASNAIVGHSYRRPGEYVIQLGVTSSDKQDAETTLPAKKCVTKNVIILRRRRN